MRPVAALVLLLLAGCGGSGGETRLTVEIGYVDPETLEPAPETFEVRCDPPGGTAPNPAAVCAALDAHPAMVRPPDVTSSCAGSVGIPPEIAVHGVADGEPVDVVFRCHGPEERAEAEELWRALLSARDP